MEYLPFLTERQNQDVEFCETYKKKYAHGADGHNRMITVAELAERLTTRGNAEDRDIEKLCLPPECVDTLFEAQNVPFHERTKEQRALSACLALFRSIDKHLTGYQRHDINLTQLGIDNE